MTRTREENALDAQFEAQEKERIESLPLRYELLFDGDNRGWRTGIDCTLELSVNPLWINHNITDEDRELLEQIKQGNDRDKAGNFIDWNWLVDDFIESARCMHPDHKILFRLEWIDGSIFAVPVELNEHEILRLYGEE